MYSIKLSMSVNASQLRIYKVLLTDIRVGRIIPFFVKLEENECFLWPNCPLNTNLGTKMGCADVFGR